MNNVEISVYIPNYNYGEYLENAIESLFKQTLKNLKLLLLMMDHQTNL